VQSQVGSERAGRTTITSASVSGLPGVGLTQTTQLTGVPFSLTPPRPCVFQLGTAYETAKWGVYTIQQTSSKLPANVMLDVCWTFARSSKHPIKVYCEQALRETQRGPGKHSRGAPLGSKFSNFFLWECRIQVYLIFLSDSGAPNVAGPLTYSNLLPIPLLYGADCNVVHKN